MSREYRPSVVYAKPDKTRTQQKYDPRQDAYRLYQYREPAAQQDHHNRHYGKYGEPSRRQPAAAQQDHYNHHYRYEPDYGDRHGHGHGHGHGGGHHEQYLSSNRKYQFHAAYHPADGPPAASGHAAHPSYYKDYRNHPLQELFQPPEGHKGAHAADVHTEPSGIEDPRVVEPGIEPPETPLPPDAPHLVVDDNQLRKPRKIREYRIRRKTRDDSKDSESGSSDSEGDAISPAHGREEKHDKKHKKDKKDKKKKKKDKGPPAPDNWYAQTHPEKYIKLGDITYVRARAFDKKWVERLMSAFEGLGFVVIGLLYKGGDAILKIIAPIAIIKSYTELLSPALQTLVKSVSGGA